MIINGREVKSRKRSEAGLRTIVNKKQAFRRPFTGNSPNPVQQPIMQSHLSQQMPAFLNSFSTPKPSFLELKGRIISFIKQNGPVLPIQVAKAFGKDTMFAGAILSELIANGVLKVTSAKIGSSPVYYMPEQESKLEILREHLGKAPKQAYDALKEKEILRDNECEPWQRVALRELKDFASPIAVRHDDGSEEVFWRWHLLSEDDARKKITSIVSGKVEEILVEPKAVFPMAVAEPIKLKPEPIEPKPEPIKPEKPDIEDPRKKEQAKKKTEKPKEEKLKKLKKEKADAYKNELLSFMQQKGLEVLEEIGMKKSEYGFVVRLDSSAGKLSYMAIAKKKKKLSDDDVAVAYSIGLQHKLPVILIGEELSAKAEKLLNTGMKGVAFIKR